MGRYSWKKYQLIRAWTFLGEAPPWPHPYNSQLPASSFPNLIMPFTGVTVTMGILIPKPLRIRTSLSHITLVIWVRVRAIGESHIRAPVPGLGGGAPHLHSQGKAPWGRGWFSGSFLFQLREEERMGTSNTFKLYLYMCNTGGPSVIWEFVWEIKSLKLR